MTKILNFAWKIKGGGREGGTCEVLRPCHPRKFGTCASTMGVFSTVGEIMSTLGDILSTVGVFSTVGDIMINVGDISSTVGCSVPWGIS